MVNRKDCNPDFSSYVKQRPLLRYLLCNNCLSEDYRFYISKFSNNFTLTKSEYTFLRNVYDSDSKYQAKDVLNQENLDLVFYLLPNYTIYSKAILNYSFFSFILSKCINLEIDSYGNFLYRYVKKILNKDFYNEGTDFILLICSNLNNNLRDIKKRKKENFDKLKRMFSAILFNCGNINKLTRLFDDSYYEYKFLLFLSVYGTQIFTYDGELAKWEGIDDFKTYISNKDVGDYFLDNIDLIPRDYWNTLFNSISFLGIEFSNLPSIESIGFDNVKLFLNSLNKIQPKSKVLFKVNCKNLSTLSQYFLSIENEKKGISEDVSLEFCSFSIFTILFDLIRYEQSSILNLRKLIFNYLVGERQYTRILSVNEIGTRFSKLKEQQDGSTCRISLKDSPEIIVLILLSIQVCEFEYYIASLSFFQENDLIYSLEKVHALSEIYKSLLNKYCVSNIELYDIDKISLCFIDFEDFFVDDLNVLFDNVNKLHSTLKSKNFFDFYPKDPSYDIAKVKVIFILLNYSFVTKVNPYSPKNRITPNINNLIYIRDCLCKFDSPFYEFSVDKILRDTWFALYKYYQKFYQEIYDSNLFLREYNVVPVPKFDETEDIQGSIEDNIKRIKDFFLNLDKQD